MKNIHIIPTYKPSRIHLDKRSKELLVYENFNKEDRYTSTHNIHITSDEKINENDWYASFILDANTKWETMKLDCVVKADLNKTNEYLIEPFSKYCKKVILTTDQDLIKDGVQAINDEFLEWFVKNPSCEEVEVDFSLVSGSFKYKIIIPSSEIWKDIPEFEGYYQISNLGNVKSLSRTILGRGKHDTLLKERFLKFSTSTNGYYQVILQKKGFKKIYKVHSLVAICFLNHTPDGSHNVVIDHINEIKIDNRLENLRLIGHRENVSRSMKNNTSTYVGVSWSKNAKKWISQITIEGKTKYLGLFDNEEDANKKYLETLKDL
jgi:hypothetical protein